MDNDKIFYFLVLAIVFRLKYLFTETVFQTKSHPEPRDLGLFALGLFITGSARALTTGIICLVYFNLLSPPIVPDDFLILANFVALEFSVFTCFRVIRRYFDLDDKIMSCYDYLSNQEILDRFGRVPELSDDPVWKELAVTAKTRLSQHSWGWWFLESEAAASHIVELLIVYILVYIT